MALADRLETGRKFFPPLIGRIEIGLDALVFSPQPAQRRNIGLDTGDRQGVADFVQFAFKFGDVALGSGDRFERSALRRAAMRTRDLLGNCGRGRSLRGLDRDRSSAATKGPL